MKKKIQRPATGAYTKNTNVNDEDNLFQSEITGAGDQGAVPDRPGAFIAARIDINNDVINQEDEEDEEVSRVSKTQGKRLGYEANLDEK